MHIYVYTERLPDGREGGGASIRSRDLALRTFIKYNLGDTAALCAAERDGQKMRAGKFYSATLEAVSPDKIALVLAEAPSLQRRDMLMEF